MFDGVSVVEACRRLEAAGADVVGLNCQRGPATLLPVIRRVREAVSCHVAALPVPYRTTEAEPTFQTLTDSARSEEHTSELQSLMRISYAVFFLKKTNTYTKTKY